MSLTVGPTILFDAGTGSDAAASGAGPATAVTGTAAAHTGGAASTTITFTNSPDLSGVAQDGSHVLWLATAGGRQFTRISTVDDVAKTCVVEDTFTIGSGSAVDYAIGGKRALFNATSSRLLFTADAKGGWTIQTGTDQTGISSTITLSASGSSSTGYITVQGDSASSKRLLSSATSNVSPLTAGGAYWRINNLKFTSTAATRTNSYGIDGNASGSGPLYVRNCEFGDATDKLQHAIFRTGSSQPFPLVLVDCEVHHCLGYGLDNGGGTSGAFEMYGCDIHDNGGAGVYLQYGGQGGGSNRAIIADSLIWGNAGQGVLVSNNGGLNSFVPWLAGNVIHGNGSDGIKVDNAVNLAGFLAINNEITGNSGYGIDYTGSNGDTIKGFVDWNNYGTGSTANTSGPVAGITAGPHDLTVDPGYAAAATGNFATGAGVRAKGFPDSTRTIGGGPSGGTTSYRDIGPQHQDAGGGGGNTYVFLVEG